MVKRLAASDAVVIHGYATKQTSLAILTCISTRVPYLLCSDTSVLRQRSWADIRGWWVRFASAAAARALSSGTRNADPYRALGVRRIFPGPFTIDTERFVTASEHLSIEVRRALRSQFGIPVDGPVAVFSGKAR
jgi:hypothetical protein